jgi:hypothetical protein
MGLTKKEALRRCAEMWDDLAKTGSVDKEEAFKRLWPRRFTLCEVDVDLDKKDKEEVCSRYSQWSKGLSARVGTGDLNE